MGRLGDSPGGILGAPGAMLESWVPLEALLESPGAILGALGNDFGVSGSDLEISGSDFRASGSDFSGLREAIWGSLSFLASSPLRFFAS